MCCVNAVNFGMAQNARCAVSSVSVRHARIGMSWQKACEKNAWRAQLAGSGANCAHGHNLLLQ